MMKKRICAIALVLIFVISAAAQAVDLNARGACSMNVETGEIYYSKNAEVPMTPASLTKIMTLFVVFEKMEEGVFNEATLVPISENAAKLSRDGEATNIPLTAGEYLSVGTLIDAMVIVSACASCTAIAEFISGSEQEFSNLMNQTAAELGIEAYFTDASGLSDYNLISPKGVAQLVSVFVQKHPKILEYTSKASEYINGKKYKNTNKLLNSTTDYYYSGVDGFKTGTTTLAGRCLVSTAKKDDTRIVTVVMKSGSDYYRYSDSRKLLDDAFYRAEYVGGNVFSTDIRTYINGIEIPCYYALGKKQALCITAENLNFYGFDTHYDSQSQTLYISENPEKEISFVTEEKVTPGLPLHKTYKQHDLKAVFVRDGKEIPMKIVISLNGQCAISFDELGALFTKTWDDETRTANIYTK